MCDIREFKRRLEQNAEDRSAYIRKRSAELRADKKKAWEFAMSTGIWLENGELHPNYCTAEGLNYTRGPTG